MQKKLWQYKLFVVAINYQQMAKIFVEHGRHEWTKLTHKSSLQSSQNQCKILRSS